MSTIRPQRTGPLADFLDRAGKFSIDEFDPFCC